MEAVNFVLGEEMDKIKRLDQNDFQTNHMKMLERKWRIIQRLQGEKPNINAGAEDIAKINAEDEAFWTRVIHKSEEPATDYLGRPLGLISAEELANMIAEDKAWGMNKVVGTSHD
ncbi:uncharacterized protein LOC126836709 [Adelges cooleyi]|uniref:uncharacterized protein LOC126836709 n=1 Tax=Adelges cooleyi TaxID=133065 RepID=UPI00217F9A3D|nr:uncharacterized protein LOC126836709 [Adelges cooleyi]